MKIKIDLQYFLLGSVLGLFTLFINISSATASFSPFPKLSRLAAFEPLPTLEKLPPLINNSPTPSLTPTVAPSNTPTPTITPLLTSTPTLTPTSTSTPTVTPASTETPTPTPTPSVGVTGNIVINEVSSAGANQGEWVELYNPTGSPIDVSGWVIEDNFGSDLLPPTSPIPSNGYAVILPSGSTASVPSTAIVIQLTSPIGNGLRNEGDLLRLKDPSGSIVDAMSYGDNTEVFSSPPPSPAQLETLARSPNGVDTDTSLDWIVASTPSIGEAN